MALGATGRSFVQIVREFDDAPLAYSLSALSALVYILAGHAEHHLRILGERYGLPLDGPRVPTP